MVYLHTKDHLILLDNIQFQNPTQNQLNQYLLLKNLLHILQLYYRDLPIHNILSLCNLYILAIMYMYDYNLVLYNLFNHINHLHIPHYLINLSFKINTVIISHKNY